MSLSYIPLGDRVLIRPHQRPEQTESGLFISEHRKPDTAGTIVSLGATAGERPFAPDVKIGDFVLFSWQSGQEFWMDDERFLIMREQDLLAVVEEGELNG